MDGTLWAIILILAGITAVCSYFSIKFFIKYKRTRKARYLALSILLGFIALGLFLLLLSALVRSFTIVYGPPPTTGPIGGEDVTPIANNITPDIGGVTPPNVVYGPSPR